MKIKQSSIISVHTRIRCPEFLELGEHSIIDDYCYISSKLKLGDFFHIASCCTIAGGKDSLFEAGSYGSLASGVRVLCTSDDFVNDIGNVLPEGLGTIKNHILKGNIYLCDFVTIGANSVVMSNNYIPEGTVIGALSFVPYNFDFQPWSVYAMKDGKLTKIKDRNKVNVLEQQKMIQERLYK